MRTILLITVVESAIVAVLLLLWRFRNIKAAVPVSALAINPVNKFRAEETRSARHKSRWAFLSQWMLEPQADDRMPVVGGVVSGNGSAAGMRSRARRRHQAMYKEWSQGRHD